MQFTDVTERAGVRFRHVTGASGRKYLPETMGSGAAFLDYDGDGRLDLFLVNSRPLPGYDERPSTNDQPHENAIRGPRSTVHGPSTCRLYRNRGNGTFADVTAGSGLDRPLYGMGCAAADYDGDGRVDLFVTACLDGNRLYRNLGGGRFRDVTAAVGLVDRGWGTSCAWLDYDRDGDLDLFVCRYARYRLGETDRDCFAPDGTRMYCDPRRLAPDTCLLYQNERGRRFRDVSAETGIAAHPGKALGVAVGDIDADGWPDLVIANDTEPNHLFRNVPGDRRPTTDDRNRRTSVHGPRSTVQRPRSTVHGPRSSVVRRFDEIGLEAGVAMPENGEPRAGMGIDLGDLENDGRLAVLVSNFSGEGLSLYQQDAPRALSFTERAYEVGLGAPSLNRLGFGLLLFDYDSDARLDAFVANGHIQPDVARYSSGVTHAEPKLLFRNLGRARFEEVGGEPGGPLARASVARGAACGDWDDDGDLDLVVTNNGGPVELIRNEVGDRNHWLQVRLIGEPPNTDAVGAEVTIRAGGIVQRRTVRTGSSYLSQSATRLHFGLGATPRVEHLEVRWPDGSILRRANPVIDQILTLRRR